jgi:segregation and condensation protein A
MKPELTVLTAKDAPKPDRDGDLLPAQGEMPFAVVDGEPVTELPQDLYIPPYALKVRPAGPAALPDPPPEPGYPGHSDR